MSAGDCLRYLFFFTQKTAYEMATYWSSDVCSSDLLPKGDQDSSRPRWVWVSIQAEISAKSVVSGLSCLGLRAGPSGETPNPKKRDRSPYLPALSEIGRASCRDRE